MTRPRDRGLVVIGVSGGGDSPPTPARRLALAAARAGIAGPAFLAVSFALLGSRTDHPLQWGIYGWATCMGLYAFPAALVEGTTSRTSARPSRVGRALGIWALGAAIGVVAWHQLVFLALYSCGLTTVDEFLAEAAPKDLSDALNAYVWAGAPSLAFGAAAYLRLEGLPLRNQVLVLPLVVSAVTIPAWAVAGAHPQALGMPLAAAVIVPLASSAVDRFLAAAEQ